MPYAYYNNLSKALKAVYVRSDQFDKIPLPSPSRFAPKVSGLEAALGTENRAAVRKAASELVLALCFELGVGRVNVRVLDSRPRDMEGELHGLYIREEGKTPMIRVWMRTSAHKKVVAFRTFLRTLLHELCHHLDYTLIRLPDTLHTEGFFRRESNLYDQLLGKSPGPRPRKKGESTGKRPRGKTKAAAGPPAEPTGPDGPAGPSQLELPFGNAG